MSAGMTPAELPWLKAPLDALLAQRDRLPHALLLHGPAGIGLSVLAHGLAQALLCETPQAGHACGRCAACGWFLADNHPDFRRVAPIDDEAIERAADKGGKAPKASKEIKVDQIRALAGFAGVGAHRGGRRIVQVDPADAMNGIAANALLKTLEEPTPGLNFLLVSARPFAMPATIRSRCVKIRIAPPSPAQAASWLASAGGASAQEASDRLAAAGGAPLLAARFADAGVAAAHRMIVETLAALPDTGVLKAADALAGLPPPEWMSVLQAWVADLGRLSAGGDPQRFPAAARRLALLASGTALSRIGEFAAWLDRQRPASEHPLNARLFCESVLIRYTRLWDGRG